MRVVLQEQDIGEIIYEESYWTGKKTITVNGWVYQKAPKSKTTYVCYNGENAYYITVSGTFLSGVSITFDNGKKVQVTKKAEWYEVLLSAAGIVFILIWGNVPSSVEIFPVIGGALGGAISAAIGCFSIMVMRERKAVWQKLLVGIGFFALTLAICNLFARLILGLL